MKQCIEWLDSKYPNNKWHKDEGTSWSLENDNSNFLSGITHVPSEENKKLTHPIAIYCKLKETSADGVFYEGMICAELAGDFHLGYARQLTDKSSLLFDLAF